MFFMKKCSSALFLTGLLVIMLSSELYAAPAINIDKGTYSKKCSQNVPRIVNVP
jgi:hypothetical protein